jgi:hypothetical protein
MPWRGHTPGKKGGGVVLPTYAIYSTNLPSQAASRPPADAACEGQGKEGWWMCLLTFLLFAFFACLLPHPVHVFELLACLETDVSVMEIVFLGYETIGDHTEFALQVSRFLGIFGGS